MDELTQDIRQEEYNLLEKNEIDRFISQEEASLATQAHADKVNNLTDYEHKQVKKDNEDLIHTLITDIRNEIGMNEVEEKPSDILKNIDEEEAQRTPPDDEPKSKGPAKPSLRMLPLIFICLTHLFGIYLSFQIALIQF